MSKYETLSTDTLLKAIQRGARFLASQEAKKAPSGRRSLVEKDLSQMRMEIVPRLKAEDRSSCWFFRTDTHVLYHKYQPPQAADDWSDRALIPDKHGIVTGHVDGKVLVQFDGEEFSTICWPQDLKIKYIRS